MSLHPNKLYDRKHDRVYPVEVCRHEQGFMGTIDLSSAPKAITRFFAAYASAINQQLFSEVDALEAVMDDLGFEVGFQDSARICPVEDLQVFGSNVVFRVG